MMYITLKDLEYRLIKEGKRNIYFMDAYIYFENKKTGETMRREVISAPVSHEIKNKTIAFILNDEGV